MELENGKITILASEDKVTIEIRDSKSSCIFCKVELTPEQFCQALSRLADTETKKMEVFNLEKINKKMEVDTLVFEVSDIKWQGRSKIATEIAEKHCPDGWEPDNYFGSKNSFFERDGKKMARTIIRRWVP